jgi:hypothetical protein
MPENRWSPTADVIDVFISIDVRNSCAFPARNEKWFAANIAKRAYWRIYAAGNALLRAGEEF